MAKPRIIMADTDINYLLPLQLKFIEEFFEKIELEIITDKEYFEKLFLTSQKIDILIISEEMYDSNLRKHNIQNIFLMTEHYEEGGTEDLTINYIYKYTSINEIFNKIISKSESALNIGENNKNDPQIILVYSASGGTGKTTVALGISNSLSKNYKKVLYIDAEYFQTFQHFLVNETPIYANELYSKLSQNGGGVYQQIKYSIRTEQFSYLPPLKAPLMSFGISITVFLNIVKSAKDSMDYDFIIIDTDSILDENKSMLMSQADKIVIVMNQTKASIYSTEKMLENINDINNEKYIFICNKFNKNRKNHLNDSEQTHSFNINHYIEEFSEDTAEKLEYYEKISDIQKTALLFL